MKTASAPAGIAVVHGLADALRQELGTGEEQLELFPESLPLPRAARVALRALVVQANTMPSNAGPKLNATEVIAAIEGERHPDPDSGLFQSPARIRRLRLLASGLAGTQALDECNATRVGRKLSRIEAQGVRALFWKSSNPGCQPWGVAGSTQHRLRGELFRRLLEPPHVAMNGWRRETTVLGCVRYVLDPVRRTAAVEILNQLGHWEATTASWVLDEPLVTWHWVQTFVARNIHLARDASGNAMDKHTPPDLGRFIKQEVEASGLMPIFRRELIAAIGLEPRITGIARAIAPPVGPWRTESSDYAAAWRYVDTWTGLIRENPDLAILLRAVHRDEKILVEDGFKGLKALLLERGIGKSGWQFLCRYGRAAFDEALAAAPEGRVVDYVVFHASTLRLWQGLLPQRELLASLFASAHLVRELATLTLPLQLIVSANCACMAAKVLGRVPSFIDDEWLPVLAWFIEAKPRMHRNQWTGGWKYLVRAKDEWLLARLAEDGEPEWHSHVGSLWFGQYQAEPLLSRAQLVVEGVEMAHCVADYADSCVDGHRRIFSIRDPLTAKRLATLSVDMTPDGWKLHQLRGRANAPVPEAIGKYAEEVVRVCRETPCPPEEPSKDTLDIGALLATLED